MKTPIKSGFFLSLLMFLSAQGLAQHIDSIDPENPFRGGSITILGNGFADQQGPWRVRVYRIVSRRSQDFYCSVLSWSSTRIRVEVPADIPADDYVLHVCDPEHLTRVSNGIRLAIRERPVNQPPPSMAPWISRAHVTVQTELWIYGQHFGAWGGGTARELPPHARVSLSGNGVHVNLEVILWRDDVVKAWLPVHCEPGEYQVAVIKGEQAWNKSNRMSFMVRPEMVGQEHPGNVPGFMHIDAARPIPIERGRQFTILGNHFDAYRREANNFLHRIGQGRRVVQLVDVHRGRARAHDCAVHSTNPATDPDYLDQGNRQWFNDHIIVTAPNDLEPGEFLLRILDREDSRSSNTLVVRVVKNSSEALHIDGVSVSPILAGGVRELTLRGQHFGRSQGQSRMDINPGNPGFLVQDWSDERIRLQLGHTIQPGRYSIRVFADESRLDGSNQFSFDVAGPMQIDRVSIRYIQEDHASELTIQGRYFGKSEGQRFIDIDPNASYRVWQWSDNEIRITLSSGTSPGRHSIRILEGGDYPGGSNTVHFEVPANRP